MKVGLATFAAMLCILGLPAWLIATARTSHVPPNGSLFSPPAQVIILAFAAACAAVAGILAGVVTAVLARRTQHGRGKPG